MWRVWRVEREIDWKVKRKYIYFISQNDSKQPSNPSHPSHIFQRWWEMEWWSCCACYQCTFVCRVAPDFLPRSFPHLLRCVSPIYDLCLFFPLLTRNIFVSTFYLLFVYNHLKKYSLLKSLIFLELEFILAFSVLYTFSNHCIQIIGKKC